MSLLDGATARRWIEDFDADFLSRADQLGELDRRAGDGDFADNIASALGKVRAILASEDPQTFRAAFTALSRGFLDTGGTSGPLFGLLFRSIAKAAPGDQPAPAGDFAVAVAAGLEVIKRHGGASVGDSTLVDALEPASEALAASAPAGVDAALSAAAEAARAGAVSTEALVARRGRASYVGEHAVGVLDPGAELVALFFAAGVRSTRRRPDTARC
ncbi:MAG: DAK2 domain-containing protein [Microbacterium sp.]